MATFEIPISYSRRILEERSVNFNNFKNLTHHDLYNIFREVEIFKSHFRYNNNSYTNEKFTIYSKALKRLREFCVGKVESLKTFDEKILFLIFCVDPEFLIYKYYLACSIVSLKEIENETNKIEKAKLIKKRERGIGIYNAFLLNKFQTNDMNLLKYEKIFFENFLELSKNSKDIKVEEFEFLGINKLVKGIRINYVESLSKLLSNEMNFANITEERYNELSLKAQDWLIENEDLNNQVKAYTLAYNIVVQKELLGLNSIEEQFVFFILAIDSNLDLLKISEEESQMEIIRKRSREELGFFSKEMINVEKLYHKHFCPDKKISIWSL